MTAERCIFTAPKKGASTFEKVSPIPLPFKQKRRLSRNVTNRRKKADYPDRKCQSKLIIPDKQNYFSLPPKKIDLSDNERMKRTAESSTDQVSKLAINFYNQPRVCFFRVELFFDQQAMTGFWIEFGLTQVSCGVRSSSVDILLMAVFTE